MADDAADEYEEHRQYDEGGDSHKHPPHAGKAGPGGTEVVDPCQLHQARQERLGRIGSGVEANGGSGKGVHRPPFDPLVQGQGAQAQQDTEYIHHSLLLI